MHGRVVEGHVEQAASRGEHGTAHGQFVTRVDGQAPPRGTAAEGRAGEAQVHWVVREQVDRITRVVIGKSLLQGARARVLRPWPWIPGTPFLVTSCV